MMNFRTTTVPAFLLCALLLVCTGLAGQQDRLYVERLGSAQGFSANYVTDIFQDKEGFIWVGTFAGLNRYDGQEVKEFTPDPRNPASISGIRVFSIEDDDRGNLWVGTTGKGLNFYDRSTNTFSVLTHDPQDPESLPANTINHIIVDAKKRIWVGTSDGLSVMDSYTPGQKARFRHVRFDRPGQPVFVSSMFEDRSGAIWLSARSTLYKVEEAGGLTARAIGGQAISSQDMSSMVQLASGEMIVGGPTGLYLEQSPGSELFLPVGGVAGIADMAYNENLDQLWVGASTGLYKYSVGRNGERPELMVRYAHDPLDARSLSNSDITALYLDATGVIWAGTSGGGLNRFDPQRKQFHHYRDNSELAALSGTMIRTILEDSRGHVWVGSDGSGMVRSSGPIAPREEVDFQHFSAPKRVYSALEVDNPTEHALYFGANSSTGLYRIDLETDDGTIRPVDSGTSSVFALLQDSRGIVWIGDYFSGLHRWIPSGGAPGGYRKERIGSEGGKQLPSNIVRSLAEDKSGNIWVGTSNGLVRIDAVETLRNEPDFTVYRNDPGDVNTLSNDYILPITVSRDGTVWVGTFGGGLNRYEPAGEGGRGRFRTYRATDGMVDEVIKAIVEDRNGLLWISSNDGLTRFDPAAGTFENFGVNDGLQGDEFGELAGFQQEDGSLLFGGANGLTLFYPDAIKLNDQPARPVVTGMSILNKTIEVGEERDGQVVLPRNIADLEELELNYQQNSISFRLGALHYAAPEKNQLAYQLEGFDEDWIYTSAAQGLATYTNLPYGDYVFRLRASNNDGLWNEEEFSLPVSISPPFWLTPFAYAFYIICFLGALYLLRRYTVIDIEEKNKIELKKLNQEKTEELNQLKLQFFTNISHEFRTPLTLIAGPLESLIRNQSVISPEQRNQYYHLMYKNSKYLLRLVNELLDFRRLDQGQLDLRVSKNDVVDYVEQTVAPFEFLATNKGINFTVRAEESPIAVWFSPEVLEKILFNLLSNAFKFTPAGGQITVTIGKTQDNDRRFDQKLPGYGGVIITVADTGEGIPRKKVKHIFNRFYKGSRKDVQNREGAGIGLAYTKSLIELHRGIINVDSTEGEGTTFYVRLPLDKSVYHSSEIEQRDLSNYVPQADPVDYFMPEENNQEEEQNARQLQGSPLARQRAEEDSPLLLYIDDNPDLRNYIRKSFSSDFRIIAADGGEAGIELAITSLPDIIVSDVMMPGIDGMEVLEKLKANPVTSHIPVILLTAKDSEESRMQGLRHGADGYVTKPFSHEVLLQQILNIVQHRDILRDRFRREVITQPADVTVTDSDELFLRQAMDIVEENMSNTEFSVDQLVKEMGVSRSKLYLKLKALTGQSSSEFVRTVRLKRAVQLLENSNYSVKEVMYMTGFSTASYFSKCFKRQFGIVPSEYVKQSKAQQALTQRAAELAQQELKQEKTAKSKSAE